MRFILLILFSCFVHAGPTPDNVCNLSENLICGSDTELSFFGTLGNKYKVFNYTYVFNNGTRAANRILFTIRDNEFVGMFNVDESPLKIKGYCIYFNIPEEEGNSICLKDGVLPQQAWVDGSNLELFR
jgi:hypothetical protein